jgi:hypothetical protein
MNDGPIYIPTGGPGDHYPTEERAPDAVLFMRLYAGFLTLCSVTAVVLAFASFAFKIAASSATTMGLADSIIILVFYGFGGIGLGVPAVVLAIAPRKPWVHSLGIAVAAVSSMSLCCIPMTVPLLMAWTKPHVKTWFTG